MDRLLRLTLVLLLLYALVTVRTQEDATQIVHQLAEGARDTLVTLWWMLKSMWDAVFS